MIMFKLAADNRCAGFTTHFVYYNKGRELFRRSLATLEEELVTGFAIQIRFILSEPDGEYIVVVTVDFQIYVWADDGECFGYVPPNLEICAAHPAGRYRVFADNDNILWLVDPRRIAARARRLVPALADQLDRFL